MMVGNEAIIEIRHTLELGIKQLDVVRDQIDAYNNYMIRERPA